MPGFRVPDLFRGISPALIASALVGLLGCTGVISDRGVPPSGGGGGPTGPGPGPGGGAPDLLAQACAASNGALNAGLTPARRLTRVQIDNTLRDLVGVTGNPADGLAPDEHIGPFPSNAIAPVDETLVVQHQEMAAAVATAARARMGQIAPCDLAADTGTTTTCATRFVTEFGRRAFRRPLADAEVQRYVALYTLGRQGDGAANGFRLVVEAMLQSPFFLYHHDVGATGTPQAGTVAITPYELASRLSFFLWNTMPDEPLFAAAANGTLTDAQVVTAQVQRMLGDDRAAGTIALFHQAWLGLEDLPGVTKDPGAYPSYDAALADAMAQETAMFTDYVVRGDGGGLLSTLLTSNVSFPQGGLFTVYGQAQPAGFVVGDPVALDGTRRAGILTQAAFLTRHAHGNQTSPVHRGLLVRENLICGTIDAPPPEVNTTPPMPSAATSTRQRFAEHEANPVCGGCHMFMDPIGLGLENFDAIGAYRTMDGLGPVDARGEIRGAEPDLAGTFNGAVELAAKLAGSREVSNCVAAQWFRFSMGRMETMNDACSVVAVRDAFRASGGNIRELLAQIALSAAFRNVRLNGG